MRQRRRRDHHAQSHPRAGVAPMEAVMVLALIVPAAMLALVVTADVCKLVYGIINTVVTWPYL